MFSSTTIESSTTMPVASARPPSDITLSDRCNWSMKKNVAISETGSDSEMMNVLHASPRKKKMIRIASTPPSSASTFDFVSACWMNTDWSSIVVSLAPLGSDSLSLSSCALTACATLTVLRVAFLVDRQLDRLAAVDAHDAFALLVALADVGDVLEAHRHVAVDLDQQVAHLVERA